MAEATEERAYGGNKFSYTSPHDSILKRLVIGTVERITGRQRLQDIYNKLHEEDPTPYNIWPNALAELNIKVDYDKAQLAKAPKSGPTIFIANHPFGVVDGAIILDLVTKVRKDYFVLVNEVISHEPVLQGHFLPVDFRNNEEALATNLRTKELTTERINNGDCLAIFPSGAVSTVIKFFSNELHEFPWRKFICTRIHETQCTVVPLYFHGRNSRLFHFVSKISMNLRLGLLLHEITNKIGKTIQVEVGDPITYDEMKHYPDRQDLIDFLRDRTMNKVRYQRPKKKTSL